MVSVGVKLFFVQQVVGGRNFTRFAVNMKEYKADFFNECMREFLSVLRLVRIKERKRPKKKQGKWTTTSRSNLTNKKCNPGPVFKLTKATLVRDKLSVNMTPPLLHPGHFAVK